MSYGKALDLLRLADLAAARYRGITLDEIREEMDCSHRTAQRLTDALEAAFPHAVECLEDPDRRRRWKLAEVPLARLRLAGDAELAALEMAADRFRDEGDLAQARTLEGLRDRLLAALPGPSARRAEADAEAVLEAHGMAARPGPVPVYDPQVAEAVSAALRGPVLLDFGYRGTRRRVEPYGVLLGARRYLVARQPDRGPELLHFRFDLIEGPEPTDIFFARDPGFSLKAHAARAFGSYQSDREWGEVVWRFTPEAADRAAEWRFHPDQTATRLPDGGLEVRFMAGGWLEMCWHLYQWGDAVEVLAPDGLREMVAGHRRGDFAALP